MKMKEEIIGKVTGSLAESSYDAVLVFGYDNIQYLTGAYLHYPPSYPDRYMAVLWPKDGEPVCIVPQMWESSLLNLSWITETRAYREEPGEPLAIVEAAAALVKDNVVETGTVGVDTERMPLSLYQRLEETLLNHEIAPCDEWIAGLRSTKTPGEQEFLEEVAYRTDHAISGEAHHILVTAIGSEMGESENIRIHAIERELDEVGHHAIAKANTGPHAKKFWPLAPKYGVGYDRKGKHHELVRMELNATLDGYWSTGARMLVLGEPSDAQSAAYGNLVALREAAERLLKPGARACDVHGAIMEEAGKVGAEVVPKLALGHGVGVSVYEPPYINAADETPLAPGMVLVLSLAIYGPEGELVMAKDTYIVTEDGSRRVGWHKDWREPFIANYTF